MTRGNETSEKPSIYLDANILLEILLGRKNQESARRLVIENYGSISISALTAHLVLYFGSSILNIEDLHSFLGDYKILALDKDSFEWAFVNYKNKDFEDALQLAVAIKNGQTVFYTLDKALYASYKNLTIISVQLLK